jgi:transposase-like protein
MADCPKCEHPNMRHEEDDRPMLRVIVHTYTCRECGHTHTVEQRTNL